MLGSNLQQDWVVLYVGSGLASSLLRCSVISDLLKGFSVSVPDSYFTFTFMHLADAFIQSDLQLHSGYTFSLVWVFPGNRTHNLLRC